ncbi:MAG: L-serine ammonia-lyase, iron-sulfur-dependent, subunit alpha [Colwellia sp.]|nr:L-serine ammonia-lyase, iron-sulfur-dependent, subunit alpha [Colwellia sp.]
MNQASIFNDVLGPVMRGPSSSHSAGALRIGRIALDLVKGDLSTAIIEYDPNGSLVTTHKSQGSDMGLFGGFLGWDADDSRLIDYQQHLEQANIIVDIRYISYQAQHPNTYKLTLNINQSNEHQITAISTGGGMMEVVSIDQAAVSLLGDSFVLLIYIDYDNKYCSISTVEDVAKQISSQNEFTTWKSCKGSRDFIIIESCHAFDQQEIEKIFLQNLIDEYRFISPVMPILNNPATVLPFKNCFDLLKYAKNSNSSLWQCALDYEVTRSGLTSEILMGKMEGIRAIMSNAAKTGLAGTAFVDRLLPAQSPNFQQKNARGELLSGGMLNDIIMNVTAIMEAKSSMNTIVAAPTAGSCGAMAGAVIAASTSLGVSNNETCQALFVAGLIGVFIANDATFAAEEAGCMAECGSGSAMAAAALVSLHKGSIEQALAAASMALQNSFGLVCDPIANRVEAPCLGKNVMAASNALSCANMALANFQQVIPLDEVIIAMAQVGKAIPRELCCTALGGLSITPTAQKLEQQLEGKLAGDIIRFKSC